MSRDEELATENSVATERRIEKDEGGEGFIGVTAHVSDLGGNVFAIDCCSPIALRWRRSLRVGLAGPKEDGWLEVAAPMAVLVEPLAKAQPGGNMGDGHFRPARAKHHDVADVEINLFEHGKGVSCRRSEVEMTWSRAYSISGSVGKRADRGQGLGASDGSGRQKTVDGRQKTGTGCSAYFSSSLISEPRPLIPTRWLANWD